MISPVARLAGKSCVRYSLAAVRVPARKTEVDRGSPEGKLLVSWTMTSGDAPSALVGGLPDFSLRDRLLT